MRLEPAAPRVSSSTLPDSRTSRPLTNSAPDKLGPHIFGDPIRPLQTRPPTIYGSGCWLVSYMWIIDWKHMQIMRVVMDINACCAWYWHFMILTLSTFWKKDLVEYSGIFTQTCMSVLHETKGSLDVGNCKLGLDSRKPGSLRTSRCRPAYASAVWSAPVLFAYWKVSYLDLLLLNTHITFQVP